MNIVYCTDNNYFNYMQISMISLLENNSGCKEINIYIISFDLSEENENIIKQVAANEGRNIEIVRINRDELKLIKSTIPVSCFLRLFIPKLIKCKKILYLDCDVLIRNSLEDLWKTDISDYFAGMVIDTVELPYRESIGFDKNDVYYNSGVMLINCAKWIECNIFLKFEDFLRTRNYRIPHNDQGVINAVLKNQIKTLPLKYNVMPSVYEFTREQNMKSSDLLKYYSVEEFRQAGVAPAIIHFCAGFYKRPWEKGCCHPRKEEYLQYAAKIEGFRYVKEKRPSVSLSVFTFLYYNAPFEFYNFINSIRKKLMILKFKLKYRMDKHE